MCPRASPDLPLPGHLVAGPSGKLALLPILCLLDGAQVLMTRVIPGRWRRVSLLVSSIAFCVGVCARALGGGGEWGDTGTVSQ